MGERRRAQQLPASDWPKIVHRHLSGDDAESIARDFGCTQAAVTRAIHSYLGRCGELMAGFGAPALGLPGLDPMLSSRVSRALIRFIESLEAARREVDEMNLDALHESSDELMRAIARLRIELARAAARR